MAAARSVRDEVMALLRRDGAACARCLAEASERSRSGVRAACLRLVSEGAARTERQRTCRRCRMPGTTIFYRVPGT
jgi:hypothetical protein